jgi:phosphoglycolate phosphatase-like HAD superfamily hydrolase
MSRKKIVILDLDDTLLYTIQTGFKRVNYSLGKLKKEKLSWEQFNDIYGRIPFPKCVGEWVESNQVEEFLNYYEESKTHHKYSTITDIKSLINNLVNLEIEIAIVTNTPAYKLEKKLSEVAIEASLFSYIHCDAMKPSGNAITETLRLLNYYAHEAIYVGDSLIDYYAASEANVDFYAVMTGNTSNAQFVDNGVELDKILESIEFLPQVFQGITT